MVEIERWLEQFKKHLENRFDQLDHLLINLKANEHENTNESSGGFFRR